MNLNPVTLKKLKRFKSIKRGYYSFVIFSVLVVISLLAELLVNSRALAVYLFTRTGLTASVLPGWDNLSSRCTP